jgi:hypothetical protein
MAQMIRAILFAKAIVAIFRGRRFQGRYDGKGAQIDAPATDSNENTRSVPSGREDRAVLGTVKDASRRLRGSLARDEAIPDRPSTRRALTWQVGSGKWSRQSHQEISIGDTAPPADETGTNGHMMCYQNWTS